MILVTGSSGFVGRHLIPKLIKDNYEICCPIRKGTDKKFVAYLKNADAAVEFGSLTDYKFLVKVFKKYKFSHLVHLAGIIKSNSKDAYKESNITSTLYLTKLCKKANVQKIIFISSDLAALQGATPYGKSKFEAESIIKNSNVPYVILRPTVIYGKGDAKFIMRLVKIARKFPIIPVIGDGEYIFQPVFVDDITKILVKSLNIKGNKIYNVCCDEVLTLNELIDIVACSLNKRIYKIHLPLLLMKPLIRIYELISPDPSITTQQLNYFFIRKKLSNELVKKELKIKFTKFEEGILKSI